MSLRSQYLKLFHVPYWPEFHCLESRDEFSSEVYCRSTVKEFETISILTQLARIFMNISIATFIGRKPLAVYGLVGVSVFILLYNYIK